VADKVRLWSTSNSVIIRQVEDKMATAKEHIAEIIKRQPDDSSYDDIVRELAFEEMKRRIKMWQK
jgi:ribosomal protein S3AE